MLQICLDQLELNGGEIQNSQIKWDLLSAIFRNLLERPNFTTGFCEALNSESMTDGFLEGLSKAFKLSMPERIGIGLALFDSENPSSRMRGKVFHK